MRRGSIAILIVVGCLFGLAAAAETTPINFNPEIPLPNFLGGPITPTTLAEYIKALFVYFIWSVGLLAVVMVVYGGIKWVAAAGNAARINDARDIVNNAIIGLIIALTSVVLLNLISPQFTKFKGITLITVKPIILELSAAVKSAVGSITPCTAALVTGNPVYVGSQVEWTNKYNDFINKAASAYKTDPFLIKSIIQQESLKKIAPNKIASPYSGPAGVPESRTSSRLSSSYGLGQWIFTTLAGILKQLNGSMPAECPEGAQARDPDGSLNDTCAAWLDKRLELQVKMVAHYLADMSDEKCVNGDLLLTAVAYHVGPGDVSKYCAGTDLGNTSTSDAINYANSIKDRYSTYCAISTSQSMPIEFGY